jgi:hypothetical protein
MRILTQAFLPFAVAAFLAATPGAAAPDHGFRPQGKTTADQLPAHAKPGSGRLGLIDVAWVRQPRIVVELPDGQVLTARQTHVTKTSRLTTWRGQFTDSDSDSLTLTAVGSSLAGFATYRGRSFELVSHGAGRGMLFEVDPTRLPPAFAPPVLVPATKAVASSGKESADTAPYVAGAAPVVHELLVMYTPQVGNVQTAAILLAQAANAVDTANSAYMAGGVGITLSLIDVIPSDVTEGLTMNETLTAFQRSSSAAAARDTYGADLMMVVSENREYCGMAYMMGTPGSYFQSMAYGVINSSCLGGTVLAHEIGHIQGLMHDRETAGPGASASRPYAFGFRNCAGGHRDIMSYPCVSGNAYTVVQFSNPNVWFDGVPFGVHYELDPANAADAVRALNDNGAITAAFRSSTKLPPETPGDLVATLGSLTRVDLTWTDRSTSEAGFTIDRSNDGVNWIEIARLAANATKFSDLTVAKNAVYSYRVSAFNGGGSSFFSGVETIAIKLPPPASPVGLTARIVTLSRIDLAWTDSSADETGFVIERATNDGAWIEIARVGPGTTRFSDESVTKGGRYAYRVYAFNETTASGYSQSQTLDLTLAPPGIPTGVTATNNRNSSATVRWDSVNDAAAFDVQRETRAKVRVRYQTASGKWKSRKEYQFVSPTLVGTIPSNVASSLVDLSGKGVFRYSVRAVNAAGSSAYSTGSVVTVTKK